MNFLVGYPKAFAKSDLLGLNFPGTKESGRSWLQPQPPRSDSLHQHHPGSQTHSWSGKQIARPNRIELIRLELDMMFDLNQGHTIDGSVQGGIFGRHYNCQYPWLWFPSRLLCSALLRLEEKKFSAEIRTTVRRFRSGSRHGRRSQPPVKSGSLVQLQLYYITCIQKPK